jgi:hypothetical protein
MYAAQIYRIRNFAFLAVLLYVVGWGCDAEAVFFNLRGLTPAQNSTYSLTAGGFTMQLGSGGTGKLTSGATTFGLDSVSVADDAALIDGGSGSAESFSISTSQYVLLESLLISHFDAIDHGKFNVKSAGDTTLANGVNQIGKVISGASANFLSWTGDTSTGGGRGFSLDGFTARLVSPTGYLASDFDNNNRVDAADYLYWRKGLSQSYTQSDYNTWRSTFGSSIGIGAGVGLSVVPEPASLAIVAIGIVWAACGRRLRSAYSN